MRSLPSRSRLSGHLLSSAQAWTSATATELPDLAAGPPSRRAQDQTVPGAAIEHLPSQAGRRDPECCPGGPGVDHNSACKRSEIAQPADRYYSLIDIIRAAEDNARAEAGRSGEPCGHGQATCASSTPSEPGLWKVASEPPFRAEVLSSLDMARLCEREICTGELVRLVRHPCWSERRTAAEGWGQLGHRPQAPDRARLFFRLAAQLGDTVRPCTPARRCWLSSGTIGGRLVGLHGRGVCMSSWRERETGRTG